MGSGKRGRVRCGENAVTGERSLRHDEERLLRGSVEHLHGPEDVPYEEDELMVVCLVRDGRPYVKSFVEHYRSLGAKHIAFLDNNSRDGTVEALREYDNVTVLRTELPYKASGGTEENSGTREVLFKQFLISRFGGKNRWCLCVDMDELFDYPYSDVVGLDSFLAYLEEHRYTALATQMLDMFAEESLSGYSANVDEPLKERHRFYDISNIERRRLKDTNALSLRDTTLESEEVESFRGGIRDTLFGTDPYLSKAPLVYLDGRVKPMDDSTHRVGNARIADVTGVLFHYKFLGEHFRGQIEQAVREEHHFMDSAKYKMYKEVLDRDPNLRLKLGTARELGSTNDLLEEQFLVVSDDYVRWVDAEEERNLRRTTEGGPDELVETLLESRRREREKGLMVQRLERRLREREHAASGEARRQEKTQRLEQRLRKRSSEARHLRQRVRSLEEQLGSIQNSRAWKVMDLLHRARVRAQRRGKGPS